MIAFGKAFAAGLSLIALGSATAAHAAQDVCLAPADLDAIFAYALPTVIDAAAQACRPVLSPDGFLATQGGGLAARYRVGQAASWPVAKAAVLKVGVGALAGHAAGGGLGKFAAMLPDSALQGFATGFVATFVVQAIHPGDCPDIEYALRLIAPLPPENAAGLITLAVRRLDRRHIDVKQPGLKSAQRPVLPLCPPQPAPSAPPPTDP